MKGYYLLASYASIPTGNIYKGVFKIWKQNVILLGLRPRPI